MARTTAIGWMPRYEDMDWTGIENFTKEDFAKIMTVDREPGKQELLSHEEMILLEKNCENEAQLFEWGDINGDFVILDEDSLRTLFDYNTHDIARLKKSFLSKRKIVIVKPKKLTYTYIHTSPIVRYDDLFFHHKTFKLTIKMIIRN